MKLALKSLWRHCELKTTGMAGVWMEGVVVRTEGASRLNTYISNGSGGTSRTTGEHHSHCQITYINHAWKVSEGKGRREGEGTFCTIDIDMRHNEYVIAQNHNIERRKSKLRPCQWLNQPYPFYVLPHVTNHKILLPSYTSARTTQVLHFTP